MGDFGRGVSIACWLSTIGNLAIISRDRYLAVSKPWWYRNHMSRSRVIKQASLIWMWSVVYGILTFASYPLRPIVILYYIISITVIIGSYVGIFIANRRQRQAIHQHGGQMSVTLKREKKLANTVGLILIVLCFTFLPALIFPLIFAILRSASSAEFLPFRPFVALFLTLNGLLNPALNYGRNENIRRAVRGLIGCPQTVVHPNNTKRTDPNYSSRTVQSRTVEMPLGQLPRAS